MKQYLGNDDSTSFVNSGQSLGSGDSEDWVRGVELGDMDGDGDLDAFIAGTPNTLWINRD